MMTDNVIKIAGLGLEWTLEYAYTYKDLLFEVGFEGKIFEYNDEVLVAYSYRSFTLAEAKEIMKNLEETAGGNDETGISEDDNP